MKGRYKQIAIGKLCGLFGKSRLAWYDRQKRENARLSDHGIVLEMVLVIRQELPRAGSAMLHRLIKPSLESMGIKMGRAALHSLLLDHGLTIRAKKRRAPRTTWSQHWLKKWPNLIRDITPVRPMHIWVADITYIRIRSDSFCYLSLISDAYSHLIVGWELHPNLSREGPLMALRMGLEHYPPTSEEIYHHSDRGLQYCSDEYVALLKSNQFRISMTEPGEPYTNQIAERINKTMKSYLGLGITFNSFEDAKLAVQEGVRIYNEVKPHSSCDYLTPRKAHQQTGSLKKWWKKGRRFEKRR